MSESIYRCFAEGDPYNPTSGPNHDGMTTVGVLRYAVIRDGNVAPLEHRCTPGDRCHSPTGFNHGYGGSGPTELARAILWDYLGFKPHPSLYQEFKREVVARLPQGRGWAHDGAAIAGWLRGMGAHCWLEPADGWLMTIEEAEAETAARARFGLGPTGTALEDAELRRQWAAEDAAEREEGARP